MAHDDPKGYEISPELSLLAKCCRRNFADSEPGAVDASDDRIDWPLFLQLARFHRVQGLVWHSLHSAGVRLPDAVAKHLRSDAKAIVATNLAIAAESRGLRIAFAGAGVDLLFLKGLSVGALAYRNPMLKMGWDIDLLIDEEQLGPAAELLRGRRYHQVLPKRHVDLVAWHKRHKESVWTSADLHVELHSRLADNQRLIPRIGLESPRQSVEIAPKITLPTLAPDELFAYLVVHGASSLWFRLKWITDFAALIHGKEGAEIERLYRRSQELGAGRTAAQALLLADVLYGSLTDCRSLGDELRREPANRWLVNKALQQIARPIEPTSRALGTLRIHLTQFGMLPGVGFKIGELVRQARAALP